MLTQTSSRDESSEMAGRTTDMTRISSRSEQNTKTQTSGERGGDAHASDEKRKARKANSVLLLIPDSCDDGRKVVGRHERDDVSMYRLLRTCHPEHRPLCHRLVSVPRDRRLVHDPRRVPAECDGRVDREAEEMPGPCRHLLRGLPSLSCPMLFL